MRATAFLAFSFVPLSAVLLSGCGGGTSPLPAYERPIAKTDFQNVRTTAYTHTESDHLEYGDHNALGGTLQAAMPPRRSAVNVPRALPVEGEDAPAAQRVSYTAGLQPFLMGDAQPRAGMLVPARYGSAAADWARWPAGTVFRLLSTGQIYKVDDYGWALAGRNTIDLYMSTRAEMNAWGVRNEPIQILHWGDTSESLRFLQSHQGYKHIRRMVLELEGREQAAAAVE